MTKHVLVLGAGFTRAFYKEAPLVLHDYGAKELSQRCRDALPYAKILLDEEMRSDPERLGRINIESLMTRLHSGMPYDRPFGYTDQLQMLLAWLKGEFVERINAAQQGENHKDDLNALAAHCLKRDITCITFNYDDLFDQALAESGVQRTPEGGLACWGPDTGYGFLMSLGGEYLDHYTVPDNSYKVRLLKLHGSMNWRPRLGASRPLSADSVLHVADWPKCRRFSIRPGIQDMLEKEPLIVPPVLMKSDLTQEPLLRLVWTKAYEALYAATAVTFIGYSMPVTDIAATSLFRETLNRLKKPTITVIGFQDHATEKGAAEWDGFVKRYVQVLPDVDPKEFVDYGALDWSRSIVRHG